LDFYQIFSTKKTKLGGIDQFLLFPASLLFFFSPLIPPSKKRTCYWKSKNCSKKNILTSDPLPSLLWSETEQKEMAVPETVQTHRKPL
jgi:hypothetical protein